MLIEIHELNVGNVGLGNLDEVAFLELCATAQAHRLTQGTGVLLRDITDQEGTPLYPGYYRTVVRVPYPHLLNQHRCWDRVAIGIDVRRYGPMILESLAVLAARPEELGDNPEAWDLTKLPSLRGGVMFVADTATTERPIAVPKLGSVAELPLLRERGNAMDELRRARREGAIEPGFQGNLRAPRPLVYPIRPGRDVAAGHALLFSRFTELLDLAEHDLLAEHSWPPFPAQLLEHRHVLEREMFYLGNTRAQRQVRVDIAGRVEPCPPALSALAPRLIAGAVLELQASIHEQDSGSLLTVARWRKILAVPREDATLVHDAARLLHQHRAPA